MVLDRPKKIYVARRNTEERNCRSLYRFKSENIIWIAKFLPENHERRGGAISNETKMKTFLRYLADPGFQTGVAEDLGIHQTTVSLTFSHVLQHVTEKAPLWIRFPRNLDELQTAKAKITTILQ